MLIVHVIKALSASAYAGYMATHLSLTCIDEQRAGPGHDQEGDKGISQRPGLGSIYHWVPGPSCSTLNSNHVGPQQHQQ